MGTRRHVDNFSGGERGVRDGDDVPVDGLNLGGAKADVYDFARHIADLDDVALDEDPLEDEEQPGDEVGDDGLRSEADG